MEGRSTYWREAEYHMKVLSCSRYKILVQIFLCGRSTWELCLHNRNQLTNDFVKLISSK